VFHFLPAPRTPAVTVNVTDIYPLTQNLTQNGLNLKVDGVQEMLFRPVIHLFGQKNRTLDGKVLDVSGVDALGWLGTSVMKRFIMRGS
jgi:hypothetical protein